MKTEFLIYGSYGYTGNLIAQEAVRRGLEPVLAGRNRERLEAQAKALGLDYRLFDLEGEKLLRAILEDVLVVLNCAGPFSRTAAPMVEGCLRTGTHYLDIGGEMAVFEALAGRHAEAQRAGVMLLPGAGFDVVPTDCLAACLAARLPSAQGLALAVQVPVAASRGTLRSLLDSLSASAMRKGGELVAAPLFARSRRVDLGKGPRRALGVPLADLVSAYRSTGIPNIETYLVVPGALRLPLARRLARAALRHGLLAAALPALPAGPGEGARARGRSSIWGEVVGEGGKRAEARLETPEPYTFTARSAVTLAEKVMAGRLMAGFQTPSSAYGAGLVEEIEGVTRAEP